MEKSTLDTKLLELVQKNDYLKILFLVLSGWALFLTKVFSFENIFLIFSILMVWIYRRPFSELKLLFPYRLFLILLLFFIVIPSLPTLYYLPLGERSEEFLHHRMAALIVFLYVVILFWQLRPSATHIWYGLILTGLAVLVVLIYEIAGLPNTEAIFSHRFGDSLTPHPIHFGLYSNLILIVLLGGFFWAWSQGKMHLSALVIAVLVYLLAVILSESRTAWIGLPEAVIAWSIFYLSLFLSKKNQVSKRTIILVLMGMLVSVMVLFSLFSDRVVNRINLAVDDVQNYISGAEAGSIGQRFVMWEVGLHGFLHSPFVGVGEDNSLHYQEKISRTIMLERIGVDQPVVYGHLHNQYIHEAFTRGVFALLGLLVFLFYLFFYFVVRIRRSKKDSAQLVWSIAGLVFIIASAVSMLTESWIHLSNGVAFFIYFIMLYYFLSSAEDKSSVLVE